GAEREGAPADRLRIHGRDLRRRGRAGDDDAPPGRDTALPNGGLVPRGSSPRHRRQIGLKSRLSLSSVDGVFADARRVAAVARAKRARELVMAVGLAHAALLLE